MKLYSVITIYENIYGVLCIQKNKGWHNKSLLILFVFVYFTTYQANSKTSLFTNGKNFCGIGFDRKE